MQTSQVITIIVSVVVSNVTLLGGLILILHRATNKRIDDFSKRFDDTNKRFDDINKRFDDTNQRFEDFSKRFDDINKRFDDINKQIDAIREDVRMILSYLLPENMQKSKRKR